MTRQEDLTYMERCLVLARRGANWVSPNPMVGCVIVRRKRVVGEGYHRRYGGPHAEVHALRQAGSRARGAVLYVNLEPCAHFGKTPPCVDSIVAAGVAEVVISGRDPNPLVRGKGIRRLRAAGIRVRIGPLAAKAVVLNERFFTAMERGRPFVGVKLAMTLDGRIADGAGRSKWITGEDARAVGHELRAQYDAVLIGATTAALDDPELTVRHTQGRNPIRIVVDGSCRLPASLKIFRKSETRTILVTSNEAARRHEPHLMQLVSRGVRVLTFPGGSPLSVRRLLHELHSSGITSVLVEGGARTAGWFFGGRLVDRVHFFYALRVLGEGIPGIGFAGGGGLPSAAALQMVEVRTVGDDLYVTARVPMRSIRKRRSR